MEKKFYKGGRPEMSESKRSDIIVKVRFNKDEHERLIERKQKTMSADLSKFIRSVCLEKPLLMKTQMETYQDIALSLLREMRSDLLRIGVNINQSSRRINSTTDYHDLRREVDQISANMSSMEAQLRMLMGTVCGPASEIESTSYDHANQ